MPTIINKTEKPVKIALAGGKTLHLGPNNSSQVTAKAAGKPGILKLVEAGDIEITDESAPSSVGFEGAKKGRTEAPSHIGSSANRRSGDR